MVVGVKVFRQGYEVHIQFSVLSCFVWDQGVSISTILIRHSFPS